MSPSTGMPLCWTIAGADPSGGAGVAADLRAFAALGVHGACVITALTAQSLTRCIDARPVAPDLVAAQIRALRDMPRPGAIKIGMVAAAAGAIADFLADYPGPVVLDPVLRSTSGGDLAGGKSARELLAPLLSRVDLLTPNAPEAEALTGLSLRSVEDLPRAAAALRALGARRVLIKGGHLGSLSGGAEPPRGWSDAHSGHCDLVHDYYDDGQERLWLSGPRHQHDARGTGCTLASAIAASVARGESWRDAAVYGRAVVSGGIREAVRLASPAASDPEGPRILGLRATAELPWATRALAAARARPSFPGTGPAPLGFYPIVDRAAWLQRLLPLGVSTLQLRIKDLTGAALEREIVEAVALARSSGARLFINDYWELALAHGAYGVHLGQEDLATCAGLEQLAKAGVRLGVSTHSYAEAAVALALRPSYMALGPIRETTCKSMRFGPQGMARIAEWRSLVPCPVVAIGGLTLADAPDVLAAGADGLAVISDLTQAPDPESRAKAWVEAWGRT